MLFKNYEYFFAIIEEGTISKAAERLYISQPSLSKYLKRLEQNLGVELFSRECYPLQLTEAGRLYLKYVKDVMNTERNLQRNFEKINESIRGRVNMGITIWRSSVVVPKIYQGFREIYPDIQLGVYEGSHQKISGLLENDKVDFCIMHFPNRYGNFVYECLHSERILLAVNVKNPILQMINYTATMGMGRLAVEDFDLFKDEPFIMLKPGQNMREITQNFLDKRDIVPDILFETSNIITAVNMVAANVGITFVQENVIEPTAMLDKIILFEVDDITLRWDVGIAYKQNSPPSKPARRLIEYLKEVD